MMMKYEDHFKDANAEEIKRRDQKEDEKRWAAVEAGRKPRPYLTSTDFNVSWDERRQNGHPRFYKILEAQAKLHSTKNTDYAKGGLQGPLGNFKRVAKIMAMYPGVCWGSPFGVVMCYLLKQLDAIMMLFVRGGEHATDEDVESRLNDLAVYANMAQIIWGEGDRDATADEFQAVGEDVLGD